MLSPSLLTSRLISLYNSGKTDSEIAKQAKCDHALINNLRHRRRRIERSSLELVLNLFPDLDRAIADACQGKLGITQIANGSASATNIASPSAVAIAGDGDRLKDCRQVAIDEIINLDIPDDIRTKVLRVLSKTLQ